MRTAESVELGDAWHHYSGTTIPDSPDRTPPASGGLDPPLQVPFSPGDGERHPSA